MVTVGRRKDITRETTASTLDSHALVWERYGSVEKEI